MIILDELTLLDELKVELKPLDVVKTLQLDIVKYEVEQSVGACLFPMTSGQETVLVMHESLLLDVIEADVVETLDELDKEMVPHPDIVE